MLLELRKLRPELLRPFGRILFPEKGEAPEVSEKGLFDFYVVHGESSTGWQIGFYTTYTPSTITLERHPNTPEVFVPLEGSVALILAEDPSDRDTFIAFELDKPVVLDRGVWHNAVTLDTQKKPKVLIVENPDVIDEIFHLAQPVELSLSKNKRCGKEVQNREGIS